MRKGRDGEKNGKKNNSGNSGHYVVASRPPKGDRLHHRLLVPIFNLENTPTPILTLIKMHACIEPQSFDIQPMDIWRRSGFVCSETNFFHPFLTPSISITGPMCPQSCPVEQIIMGSIGHDYGPLVMGVGKEDNAVQFP